MTLSGYLNVKIRFRPAHLDLERLNYDDIGHRPHRPLPLPYRPQLQRVTIGLRIARMPSEMRTNQTSNSRRLRPTKTDASNDGCFEP